MPNNRKILIIRLSSLGDIILISPVIKNIKAAWPDAEISILTKSQYAKTIANNPLISQVLPFISISQTVKGINHEKFDYIIDLHSNLRTHLITFLCRAKKILRYKKDSLSRKLFVNFRTQNCALQKHTVNRYLEALNEINVPIISKTPEINDWALLYKKDKSSLKLKNICILQTAFLGDCMLTLPLIEKIKNSASNSKITVISRPETSQIFKSSKSVDNVIIDNKRNSKFFFPEFLKLVKEVKSENFDIAIIPHRSIRSALLAFLAKIPVRIGFSESAGKIFLTKVVPFSWLLHDAERNLTLLLPLIENVDPEKTNFTASHDLSEKFKISDTLSIGINPGSAWSTKRWPKERYGKLIKLLYDKYKKKILIIGSKNEVNWNKEIEALAGKETCVNLTGKTSIEELMTLIKDLKLFITNDSGPMHIAAASGIEVIAIFGPTTKELGFFPYSEKSFVLEENLECRPCALHGSKKCPRSHFLCMNLISVERVYNQTINSLALKP
ncbi:MAG: lipopolysaccharide heptosyltransferase II [Elusimicrobia bacterium]|nr:lipopolysaccharide heptosyltransferase II [Elusimicrobiota bacterium]